MYVDMSQVRDEIHVSDQPGREDDTSTRKMKKMC